MKTYTNRETAPLAFHKFNVAIRVPLGMLFQIYPTYLVIQGLLYESIAYLYDLSFQLTMFVSFIIVLMQASKWKPSAWYALVSLNIISMIYNTSVLIFFGWNGFVDYDIASFIQFLVFGTCDCLVLLYYYKRKPLFIDYQEPTSISPKEHTSPPIEQSTAMGQEAPQATEPIVLESESTEPENQPLTTPERIAQTIYFMSKEFCLDKEIFPHGYTGKDMEFSFAYFYLFFDYNNFKYHFLEDKTLQDVFTSLLIVLNVEYDYTEDMAHDFLSFTENQLPIFSKSFQEYEQDENFCRYASETMDYFPNIPKELDANRSMRFIATHEYAQEEIISLMISLAKEKPFEQPSTGETKGDVLKSKESNFVIEIPQPLKRNKPFLICTLLLTLSLATNFYQMDSYNAEITQLRTFYENAKKERDLESERAKKIKGMYEKIRYEYAFYNDNAFIVGNSSKFHRYGCSYLDKQDGFLIYNFENARYQGYSPCKHCI